MLKRDVFKTLLSQRNPKITMACPLWGNTKLVAIIMGLTLNNPWKRVKIIQRATF